MLEIRRVTLNSSYIFVEKIAVLGVGLALFILIARYMGQQALGQYAFAYGLVSFLGIFLDLGLNTVLIREVARRDEQADRYISNVTALKGVLSFLVLLVLLIVILLSRCSSQISLMILLFGLALAFNTLGETFNSTFKGFQRMEYSTLIVVCVQVLLLFGCIYILQRRLSVVYIAWVYLFARLFHLLFAFGLYRGFVSKIGWNFDRRLCRDLVKGAVFHLPASYFLLNLFNMSMVVLFYLLSDVDVAYFGAASKLCGALFILCVSSAEGLFPMMARSFGDQGNAVSFPYKRVVRYLLILMLPIVVCLIAFPERILALVYGTEYQESARPLQILALFLPISVLSAVLHYLLVAVHKEKVGFVLLSGMMGLGFVFNILLISRMGVVGAAVSSLLCGILLFLFLYVYVSRKVMAGCG